MGIEPGLKPVLGGWVNESPDLLAKSCCKPHAKPQLLAGRPELVLKSDKTNVLLPNGISSSKEKKWMHQKEKTTTNVNVPAHLALHGFKKLPWGYVRDVVGLE